MFQIATFAQLPPDHLGDQRTNERKTGADEHRTPTGTGVEVRSSDPWPTQDVVKRPGTGARADQGREDRAEVGTGTGDRGDRSEDSERGNARISDSKVVHRPRTDDRGGDREEDECAEDERGLVVGAEGRRGKRLHRQRYGIDDDIADGDHRRALRPGECCDQLGQSDRNGGRRDAR